MGISLGNEVNLPLWERSNDEILREFEERTTHGTGRTARANANRIGAQLARYERETGESPPLRAILIDPNLLTRVLRCVQRLRGDGEISRASVSGTWQAFSALIAALPPPPGRSRDEMRDVHRQACRQASTERGLRLHAPGAPAPNPRDRFVPHEQEIEAVIDTLRLHSDPLAGVAADLIGFLYLTGVRIGAALAMTSDDLVRMPNGRIWVFAHEKARPDRRPVLVRPQRDELRDEWLALGPGVALWSVDGKRLNYSGFRRLLSAGCERASVPTFPPHRLRNAFAAAVAPLLDLGGVALAGGWICERSAEGYLPSNRPLFG